MKRRSFPQARSLLLVGPALAAGALLLGPVEPGGPDAHAAQAKDGKAEPGWFAGRTGATKEKLLQAHGVTRESEAAVSRGLEWLALHQAADGHWSLDGFHQQALSELGPQGRRHQCDCKGPGQKNDVAGTALGLLPFLGAGHTHRPPGRGATRDYSRVVGGGVRFLMSKQGKDGNFSGGMYAHGLASIALCEAFGMTGDPLLKQSAQRAIDFIVYAQHDASGGWRYEPRQSGDTSVTGFQVSALKAGQMAGLNVPAATLKGAQKWLDSVQDQNSHGYGYTSARATPGMTAVGLLCRQYLGWGPRKAELIKGVETMAVTFPGKTSNMYYHYYATQVMYHMGGDQWKEWNEGAAGRQGMRDLLIAKQNKPGSGHKAGSWDPDGDTHAQVAGRLMITSLSLLTLEVYYRHASLGGPAPPPEQP